MDTRNIGIEMDNRDIESYSIQDDDASSSAESEGNHPSSSSSPPSSSRPNAFRYKKVLIGLSLGLAVAIGVAVAFSVKSGNSSGTTDTNLSAVVQNEDVPAIPTPSPSIANGTIGMTSDFPTMTGPMMATTSTAAASTILNGPVTTTATDAASTVSMNGPTMINLPADSPVVVDASSTAATLFSTPTTENSSNMNNNNNGVVSTVLPSTDATLASTTTAAPVDITTTSGADLVSTTSAAVDTTNVATTDVVVTTSDATLAGPVTTTLIPTVTASATASTSIGTLPPAVTNTPMTTSATVDGMPTATIAPLDNTVGSTTSGRGMPTTSASDAIGSTTSGRGMPATTGDANNNMDSSTTLIPAISTDPSDIMGSSSSTVGNVVASTTVSIVSNTPGTNTNGGDDLYCLDIELLTDDYGGETGYSLVSKPEDGSEPQQYGDSYPIGSFESNTLYNQTVCGIPAGKYLLTIMDEWQGLCCAYGQGYYSLSIDGTEIVRGGNFNNKTKEVDIRVGYIPPTSERDLTWLNAHNDRRLAFHEANNKTFTPLVWSTALAASASAWIDVLMPQCKVYSEQGLEEGENMSGRSGSSPRDTEGPESIMTRWVEREANKDYPNNQSFTQVMWRATRYLGCADRYELVELEDGSSTHCYISVCRYARAGNCNVGKYANWMTPVLADSSPCGPVCPAEGCH